MDADVLTTPPTAESSSTADVAAGARRSSKALSPSTADPLWWRSAVIYQIYVRSFADGNGDGTGDLAGVRSRLGYLRDLGVDAIWFTPWYASPLADGGYDVSDYRAIHPDFGTLAEAELLVQEALALGIRTIIDIVPNHISDQHPWFQAALAAGPGSPERERFWFVDSDEIPTRWVSPFAGETWTRTINPDGTPGEWYLHLFTPEQPDLNWNHPDVVKEHEDILKFWFDRGVAGVRIDSAALLIKDPELGEVPEDPGPGQHPTQDRDELHDVYRGWRAVADSYPGTRVLVGEIWLPEIDRFVKYLRPDEMHTAFNFDFLARPWDARQLRESIDQTLAAHAPVSAPSTWVLSNHDVTRPVTRYGREDSSFAFLAKRFGVPTDLERGRSRARAAALLTAALPGSLYIYQGDELGLPEVETIPLEKLQDPMHYRSRRHRPRAGRMPRAPSLERDDTAVRLQPGARDPHAVAPAARGLGLAHRGGAGGRPLLDAPPLPGRARTCDAELSELGDGSLEWIEDLGPEVLAFRRGDSFVCVVNTGDEPVPLPAHDVVLLSSVPLDGGRLPGNATAWLQTRGDTATTAISAATSSTSTTTNNTTEG